MGSAISSGVVAEVHYSTHTLSVCNSRIPTVVLKLDSYDARVGDKVALITDDDTGIMVAIGKIVEP